MRTLLNWLRYWRRPKTCNSGDATNQCSLHQENARYMQVMDDCNKLHHTMGSSPCLLPADPHHHHDLRLLKSCRIMPLPATVAGIDDIYHSDKNVEFDEEDVDIEFSTMMRASFPTMSSPLPHQAEEEEYDAHLSFSMPISIADRAMYMEHSMSMPKLYSPVSPLAAAKTHVRFIEDAPTPRSLRSHRSPAGHSKKVSQIRPLSLLKVIRRVRLPKSPSTTSLEVQSIPNSPSTNISSSSSSSVRPTDLPSSIPRSPLKQMKRSLKASQSSSIQEMPYPALTQPHSPSTQAMESRLPPIVRKSHNGLPSSPRHSTAGLNLPSAMTEQVQARTYQPLCCSSGNCILECHVVETSTKPDTQTNERPQPKKPTVYEMTILPSIEGKVRHVRRISFKNGRWITDDSDYVVLEL